MQKLVTHFSLRLGLELSGKENCIEFHPILLDCKVRNPQNLAGSVPQTPTSANILIQKKEQKSLLLESVIDFASLVFHCVGSAITKQGGLFISNTQSVVRFALYILTTLSRTNT